MLECGVLEEAVITSVQGRSTIRLATVQHVGIVPIQWAEGFSELVEVEPPVSILLIARHKKFNLFTSGVNSDRTKTFADVVHSDDASPAGVEDCELVEQVEVSLVNQASFSCLKLLLKVAHLFQRGY